jgi:hypothetical protein
MEKGSPLLICVEVRGTDDEIKQIKDSHWFRPRESPTNIILFPLIFSKNSSPLNLNHIKIKHKSNNCIHSTRNLKQKEDPKEFNTGWCSLLPWELTIERLPSVLEIIRVRPAIHLAVEFSVNNGWAIRRLIQWVWFITNPSADKQCTSTLISLQPWQSMLVVVVVVSHAHYQSWSCNLGLKQNQENNRKTWC